MSDPSNRRCRHAGLFFDLFRREIRQALRPTVDGRCSAASRPGGPQLVAKDDVREAKRENAVHSGPRWDPLIRARGSLRDARFEMHKFSTLAGAPFAHAPITYRLRDR